ncbi:MAG TPA: hypothetical protein VNG70_01210 [Candidatus Limnocylindria bacterium]|nr:hypothetical protein [Candidatus Limnocylindria bacterium]
MSVRSAIAPTATKSEVELETELVRLALRAAEHHPILKAVYAGPLEWLEEAQADPGVPEDLITKARDLASRADKAGQSYVAGQARSVAVQLEVHLGRTLPYDQMVSQLLGVDLEVPPPDEVGALRDEIEELASGLEPSASKNAVRQWESKRLVSDEVKWDIALATYLKGRRYVFEGEFPLEIHESMEIIRISDDIWSVNLSWYPPRRMSFQVNVSTPRTPETVAFEVAHNIYPGDYLHLAVLHQHAYQRQGHVAASIKLKNAPESVISEGIEEVAYLRLLPDPTPDQLLASKLEWLRRIASFAAGLSLGVDGRAEAEVLETMARDGFMDPARAEMQLKLVKHPLWGPYQYTYLLGRKLVQEGERRAAARNAQKAFLEYLYSGLHTPQTFLPGLEQILAN